MESSQLSRADRRLLLQLAREAISAELAGVPLSLPAVTGKNLLAQRGAFVTLHKHGQLRGCIGTFAPRKSLYEVVADMALSAAFHDPRFPPLARSELPSVEIEVSALTPLRRISDTNAIQVGTHGIYIINGPYQGVLLPQVATEHKWDRRTFLDQTCIKAGLSPGCWQDPTAEIHVFSAEIFNEDSEGLRP
jgi:AmmeMemoRadiSam system protein A